MSEPFKRLATTRADIHCRPLILGMVAFAVALGGVFAQDKGVVAPVSLTSTVEQEILRRQGAMIDAQTAVEEADKLAKEGNWEAAVVKYHFASSSLTEAPATLGLKRLAAQRLAEAALHAAEAQAKSGKMAEAKATIELGLEELPTNEKLKTLRKRLSNPDYFNPAMTPQHAAKVEQVSKMLTLAEANMDLASYDAAQAAYNKVLALDPTNTAARRGLERSEQFMISYQRAARDHTRARAIREVDQLWETAVPLLTPVRPDSTGMLSPDLQGSGLSSGVTGKLKSIIIPQLSIDEVTLNDVVDHLRSQAKLLDPEKSGVGMIVRVPSDSVEASTKITLNLSDIPLSEAISYVTKQTNTRWTLEGGLVVITKIGGPGGRSVLRSYKVPPDFLSASATAAPGEKAAGADPFAGAGADAPAGAVKRVSPKEFLEGAGIVFPADGSAVYNRATGLLMVRTSEEGHDDVQAFVDEIASKSPRQALVRIYSLETTEHNLKEIGVDFLMGQFNIGPGVFGSGGSYGNSGAGQAPIENFAFQMPSSIGGAVPTPVGQHPITAGLRSSSDLRSGGTIDEVIGRVRRGTTPGRAPGAISLSGIFSDPQWQTISRLLQQKRGKDFSGGVQIVLKSGQIAKAASTRSMMVPTDFDPPQIPQNFGTGSSVAALFDPATGGLGAVIPIPTNNAFPVTPTTPTTFEEKVTGMELEVEATIPEEGNLVELTISPNFSEFEGFINYGSPILTGAGSSNTVELTRNEILQAVFRRMKVDKSTVSVYDGATIVFAGYREERKTTVEDKVPFLGDIPLVGRLFKSNVDETSKKSIIFFVQVNLLDPAGNRVSQNGATIPK